MDELKKKGSIKKKLLYLCGKSSQEERVWPPPHKLSEHVEVSKDSAMSTEDSCREQKYRSQPKQANKSSYIHPEIPLVDPHYEPKIYVDERQLHQKSKTFDRKKHNKSANYTFICFINKKEFKQISRRTWSLFKLNFQLDPLVIFMKDCSQIPSELSDLPKDDKTKPCISLSIDFNHLQCLANNLPMNNLDVEEEKYESCEEDPESIRDKRYMDKDSKNGKLYIDTFWKNGCMLNRFYSLVKKCYPYLRYFIIIVDKSVQYKNKLALLEFYARYDSEVNIVLVDTRSKDDQLGTLEKTHFQNKVAGDYKLKAVYEMMVNDKTTKIPQQNDKNSDAFRPLEQDVVPPLTYRNAFADADSMVVESIPSTKCRIDNT